MTAQSILRASMSGKVWAKHRAQVDAIDPLAKLDEISRETRELSQRSSPVLSVLQGPSFCIYHPSQYLDRLVADALRLRGARVFPIYCDGIQSMECNYFGGVWGRGSDFEKNCDHCQAQSRRLWRISSSDVIPLSSHLPRGAKRFAVDIVSGLPADAWQGYVSDGMPLGDWARDILVNNWVVGDYRLIPNHEQLGRAHLSNLLLVKASYERILDTMRPERVVSNDSYYGMWAIMEHLCRHRGIPFYSHWPVSSTRVAFAKDDAAMSLDFRTAWPAFSTQPWTDGQREKVNAWLNRETGKRGLLIETSVLQGHQDIGLDLGRLHPAKPTALMPTNVIWDLAALNKQIIFEDMVDWVVATIRWFAGHPQYQLVVKAHPAEQHPSIPETHERVETALRSRKVAMPDNVVLLSPKVKATVYDLLPLSTVGIVHTTSVGFEMAALGLPVITTAQSPYRGFGFTYDPATQEDYWDVLGCVLGSHETRDRSAWSDLARRFILFYQFHYYMSLNLFENDWLQAPRLLVRSARDLTPGKNPQLDYVVDSVMQGLPIVGDDRWPPES